MKTRTRLRNLQWDLYCANERRIREMVGTPRRFDRLDLDHYERELVDSIPEAWEVTTPVALRAAIRTADIVLVGDYHTLRQSQRGFLRVLRAARSRRIVIALEFVIARHQRAVDAFLAAEVTEDRFLKRMEYSKAWPSYQVWPNFRPIFDLARQRGAPIVALDCDSAECSTVFARDGFSAWRIAQAVRENPRAKVFALVGENHLAPGHLPAELRRALDRLGVPARILTIHQHIDRIWFDLLERGIEDRTDVVRLTSDRFVVPVSTPIAAQHSFLEVVSGDSARFCADDRAAMRRELGRYVRFLLKVVGIALPDALAGVTVCGPGDLSEIARLADRLGEDGYRIVAAQVANGDSLCLPEHGLVYLASLSPTHMAEEAAHLVKARLASGGTPSDPVDFLYGRTLHEAIGYFGSKLFNPKRKPPTGAVLREAFLKSLETERIEFAAELAEAARLVGWHRRRQGRKGFSAGSFDDWLRAEGYEDGIADLPPEVTRAVVHFLGYELGERLYTSFREGRTGPAELRRLLRTDLEAPGRAFPVFQALASALFSIRLPARF